jgi:hypothetical protein
VLDPKRASSFNAGKSASVSPGGLNTRSQNVRRGG